MTEAYEWQGRVGDVWAEEWRRTDRAIGPPEDALLAEALPRLAGKASPVILDVGCGAGSTALRLAEAIPGASVTGIDLSEALIAVARERGGGRAGLIFEVADASSWTPPDGRRFDAIVSRHGVMFFEDPIAAFTHLRGLGAPGMQLVFSCFRARAENEWAMAMAPIIERFAPAAMAGPPPEKGPFALGDPGRIHDILTSAGFAAPRIEAFDFDFIAGSGDDPVADAVGYFRRIGPFAALLRDLDPARAPAALDRLAGIAAHHLIGGRVSFRAAAWIVSTPTQRKPS